MMYDKIKKEKQKNLDLIATIMIQSGHCYETATLLVKTYHILKMDQQEIPNELSELIETSNNYNKKNLYGLFKLVQVSPDFILGLTLTGKLFI